MAKQFIRNLCWKNMTFSEKFWFLLMVLLLLILFVLIYLDGACGADIPDWIILLWVPAAGYAAYRNTGMLEPGSEEAEDEIDGDDGENEKEI